MEMYNNILVFIVGSGAPNSRSEMHIFQVCNRVNVKWYILAMTQYDPLGVRTVIGMGPKLGPKLSVKQ